MRPRRRSILPAGRARPGSHQSHAPIRRDVVRSGRIGSATLREGEFVTPPAVRTPSSASFASVTFPIPGMRPAGNGLPRTGTAGSARVRVSASRHLPNQPFFSPAAGSVTERRRFGKWGSFRVLVEPDNSSPSSSEWRNARQSLRVQIKSSPGAAETAEPNPEDDPEGRGHSCSPDSGCGTDTGAIEVINCATNVQPHPLTTKRKVR